MKNRLLILSIIIYIYVMLGLWTMRGEVLILIIPPLLYLTAGIWFGPEMPKISVKRTLSADAVSTGMPFRVALAVTNKGSILEEVLIEDMLPKGIHLSEGTNRLLTALKPMQTAHLSYTMIPDRGYYWFSALRITAGDRLGLMRKTTKVESRGRFLVLPIPLKLHSVPIRPRRTRVYSGSIPARLGGPGVEFFGLRQHQMGDAPRLINWKALARFPNTLFTNEFEQERAADVSLILDARHRSYPSKAFKPLFENAVTAAATMADALLSDGNRLGLLVYGEGLDWTSPGYGKIQREKVLRSLARAEPRESGIFNDFDYIPTHLFPVQTQLIIFSPLHLSDRQTLLSLRARGYHILVISPNPVSFEDRPFPSDPDTRTAVRLAKIERQLLLRELEGGGIPALDWEEGVSFAEMANTYFRRRALVQRARGIFI